MEQELLNSEKEATIDQIIPLEMKAILNQIQRDFQENLKRLNNEIISLEEEIKQETVNCATTVKGTYLQAIFSQGMKTWDSKALEQYSKSHPEIITFRKQGKPFVSIRQIQKQSFSLSLSSPRKDILPMLLNFQF